MKKLIALGAIVSSLALSGIASAAQGAGTDYTPYNFQFRVGYVIPLDGNLRDISNSFFGVGADYTLPSSLIRGSETFLSFDWIAKSSRGDRANLFPLMINQRFYLDNGQAGSALAQNRTYAFIGVGAVIIDVNPSNTVLGGRAGLGVELNKNLFAEGDFILSGHTRDTDVRATSFGIYVGYRF